MSTRRICEFLQGSGVRFVTIKHPTAFTAQEIAESAHVPGDALAKTVITCIDGRLAMAVVPATKVVGVDLLRRETGAQNVRIADETEFARRFMGCRVGSVPPFGVIFGMETFIDRRLTDLQHLAFNAGTHTDVIMMRYDDYERLVQPFPVRIAVDPTDARLINQCGK